MNQPNATTVIGCGVSLTGGPLSPWGALGPCGSSVALEQREVMLSQSGCREMTETQFQTWTEFHLIPQENRLGVHH